MNRKFYVKLNDALQDLWLYGNAIIELDRSDGDFEVLEGIIRQVTPIGEKIPGLKPGEVNYRRENEKDES